MLTSDRENEAKSSEQVTTADDVRRFLDTLPEQADITALRAEGEAIATILEPLSLPGSVLAAVYVYPLLRDGRLSRKDLHGSSIANLSDLINGLVQLGRFSLPADWQPGEALAVQQSEALRKMLLAVVSDVRLVLVRIAEQLYRLRLAKKAAVDEQRAIAVETREIYAALANRLGVWQLKWELEDLSFRYLEPDTYKRIAKTLKEKRQEREVFIERVKTELRGELDAHQVEADISGRPKHIYSIWRKMQRKGSGLENILSLRTSH